MKLKITIDVFSGRPNPILYLEGREADEAAARLRPERQLKRDETKLPTFPTLGYRGLMVDFIQGKQRGLPRSFRVVNGDLFGAGLSHRAADPYFENFICGSTGPIRRLPIGQRFPKILEKEIDRFGKVRLKFRVKPWPWLKRHLKACRCAPLYEPDWWNDGGQKQLNNNCYNYSTNYRTDTFAQPGQAAGAIYGNLTCASVRPAAEADCLINSPSANNKCPKEGHLVALVIWPNGDFHWYRKGRNGFWTHKPGSTPVTNVDNSGNVIHDPRTADRGPYTDFCTFMVVMHGHIKII
jgi:hypothetical protein